MKMLNAALIVALTLTSGVALAEQSSDENNRIVSPESTLTTRHESEKRHYSFSNFKHRNRQAAVALAKWGSSKDNRIISPESISATQYDSGGQHFSPSELPERNP
ncbi:hypothetical protein [Vreelandella populi]|uniref:hypothetical protein n=1 Tax=Vreelandella populi TaxID=2498858 RepID=UPI000F8C3583|nr:hypothetical protein [Halomonas populi]RUR39334.1 hypothetical protein ELY25_06760 [Halomonas populi]